MSAADIDTRAISADVAVTDPAVVEARRRQRADRWLGFWMRAGVVAFFGGLSVLMLAAGGPDAAETPRAKPGKYWVDDSGKLWEPSSPEAARRAGLRPATREDKIRHNAKAEAAGSGKRIEYRVVEGHVVKFEEGQAPYIYSMPYDVEQH